MRLTAEPPQNRFRAGVIGEGEWFDIVTLEPSSFDASAPITVNIGSDGACFEFNLVFYPGEIV